MFILRLNLVLTCEIPPDFRGGVHLYNIHSIGFIHYTAYTKHTVRLYTVVHSSIHAIYYNVVLRTLLHHRT